MKRLVRWMRCHLLDRHRNALADARGWYPLFPIRCDHCREMFYLTEAEYPRKEADRG